MCTCCCKKSVEELREVMGQEEECARCTNGKEEFCDHLLELHPYQSCEYFVEEPPLFMKVFVWTVIAVLVSLFWLGLGIIIG